MVFGFLHGLVLFRSLICCLASLDPGVCICVACHSHAILTEEEAPSQLEQDGFWLECAARRSQGDVARQGVVDARGVDCSVAGFMAYLWRNIWTVVLMHCPQTGYRGEVLQK